MPIIQTEKFSEIYKDVKRASNTGNCTVLLFVAQDCDSLCACRILTGVLRRDDILHSTIPVCGYDELQNLFKEYLDDQDEIRSIFLINCGSRVDLNACFGELPEDITIYLVDSHRPLRYENARHDRIVVLDDAEGSIEREISNLEDSDEDSDGENGGKRQKGEDGNVTEPASPTTQRRRKRKQFRDYYVGSSYGLPSSDLMYQLSSQLNRADKESLWLAIVGLTEMFLLDRIKREQYVMKVAEYQDEVSRTCLDSLPEMTTDDGTVVAAAEDHRIVFDEEFRLMMLRHWSLLESMMNSEYAATKFEVWTSIGRKKLKTMVAQMGIPLKEAEQNFHHMTPKAKGDLKSLFSEVGQEYGLSDVTYGSFHLRNGYKFQLSAADAVYAILAILAGHGRHRGEDESPEDVSRASFWEGFDALSSVSSRHSEKIEKALVQAIDLQKVVVKQGSHMISKKIITTSGVFRYAYLKDTADTHIFLNPQALTKLAFFLVSHYREKFPAKPRPFVLCALDDERDVYLVVAVDGTPATSDNGDVGKNKFGTSFNKAAEKTGARVKHDGFETSQMEIQKEDVFKFMEYLHSGLC